jgi:hypothetical protein
MPAGKLVKTAAQFAAIAIVLLIDCSNARAQMSSADILPSGQKSDGCTLIADGDIRDCCVAHDKDYFYGGTRKARRSSDNRLYECVCKKGGWDKVFAPFIWLGVRIGGLPFLPTRFRWGFGTNVKGYAKQTPTKPTINDP